MAGNGDECPHLGRLRFERHAVGIKSRGFACRRPCCSHIAQALHLGCHGIKVGDADVHSAVGAGLAEHLQRPLLPLLA